MAERKTKRVRFRAEWVEELPEEVQFAEGERVSIPHRELIVRKTGQGSTTFRDDPRRSRVWVLAAADEAGLDRELHGADVLVELGDGLASPGSTWRVRCSMRYREQRANPRTSDDFVTESVDLDHESADLGEALDAVVEWAEKRLIAYRGRRVGGGNAELSVLEPGEDGYGRTMLKAGTGDETGVDAVLGMLQAFCEEAERRYDGAPRE